MKSLILIPLICILFPLLARGQHLADVLVSLQDRQRAVEQRIQLYAYNTPNGVVQAQQLITWTGLGANYYPTAANVDALDIGARIGLLNQAVAELGRLSGYYLNLRSGDVETGGIGILRPYLPGDFEDLGRAGAGNYNQIITALALQVRHLRVLTWTATLKTATETYGIDKQGSQFKDSNGNWGSWSNYYNSSLVPGDSADWLPASIAEGGKHDEIQDSTYRIHWNWFNFRWEESVHVTGQYGYQETSTSRSKSLVLTRTRTFPIEAALYSKVPGRSAQGDQLPGKVALLRRTRWSPVPFSTFTAAPSWDPDNGDWQLVAIEEDASDSTDLGAKDEVSVGLTWNGDAAAKSATPTGFQGTWAGSNHLSRIYAAVCVPEFTNGVDAPAIASRLEQAARVSAGPSGDGGLLVHPLPGLMAGIPMGQGLEGFGSGWIGISPTNIAFADQRYVGEGGGVELDSWNFADRFMRFDYISNLRFTGSAEDFHVVYAASRDFESRGAGLPSAKPTVSEQEQSGWNAFIREQNGADGRDFFLAWDLPRIRQIVGRDLIANVEMQGHYKCVVEIYRRAADAEPVDRTPGVLAGVSEENLIRTIVIESPDAGEAAYPATFEKMRFTDGAHIIDVWRDGFDANYTAKDLHFKEMDGEHELYLKSIAFNTWTVTEKLDGDPWRTRTIPGWTGCPRVFHHPDGWNSSPRLDTVCNYPGVEGSIWWNSNPPASETITAASEATGVNYTRAPTSAGTQFGKFPQAMTITRPSRPVETFEWNGYGILTSHEKAPWKYTVSVSGSILSGTTEFSGSAVGRDWTEFIDSGKRVKSYSAPDGGVTSMTASEVDSCEVEYGDASGTGLPGLPQVLTRRDNTGATWEWTFNEDGSTTLEYGNGLLVDGEVARGTKSISITNERGYVTDTETYLVHGGTTLQTGGSSTPEGEFTVWGAPLKSLDFTTELESAWDYDNNFSRLASSTSPLGLVTDLSDYDVFARPKTVTANGITASHTYTGLGTYTEFTGTGITGTTENTRDGLGRLTSSNTTWNGLTDDISLNHGAENLGITRTHGLLGIHQSSIRESDGSLTSSTGPTLAFGGITGDELTVAAGMLKSRRQVGNLAARFQTTWTDAWGRIREIDTPPASGSGVSVATGTTYSPPNESLKRVIVNEPTGRVLITESDPYNASGSIVRSGIDVNQDGELGAFDRYVKSTTTIEGGKIITTISRTEVASTTEDPGLREILRSEWNPGTGVTVTKINGSEETLTQTPHFTFHPPLLYPTATVEIASSKGWIQTTEVGSLGQADISTLTGTGIPSTTLDPTWRADGSLAGVSLNIGGAIRNATFNTNGTLASLIVPGKGNILAPNSHTIGGGVESITLEGTTYTAKLDGTQQTASGGNIIGKTDTLTRDGSMLLQTIHPLIAGDTTDMDTSVQYNAAGVRTGKLYADATGITNFHTPGGLLESITGARGGSLTYGYSDDGAKDLISAVWTAMASATFTQIPAVSLVFGHDRAGRVDAITDPSGARSLAYQNDSLKETQWNSGPLAGYRLVKELATDGSGRDLGFTLYLGNAVVHSARQIPDGASDQISALACGNLIVKPQRDATGNITGYRWGPDADPFVATVTQTWERGTAGRVEAANSNVTGAPAFDYLIDGQPDSYSFDSFGHRLKCATADGEWTYVYTNGQLTSANHTTLGSFSYQFDGIGRRLGKHLPGDPDLNATNPLNQTIAWINDQTKTLRISAVAGAQVWAGIAGEELTEIPDFNLTGSFDLTLPATQSSGWVPWRILAVLPEEGEGTNGANAVYNPLASPDAKAEQSGAAWIPPVSETFEFDAAGNRQSSALWDYGWDGRDKLVRARTKDFNIGTTPQGYDITFDYDAEGRRFKKNVTTYQNGAIVSQDHITFIWDGWDLIYERHQLPSGLTTLERKYVWGPDISGSHDGAGGAGGLLLIRETRGTQTADIYPLYDGGGHVVALTNANKELLAEYAYGPFGELIHAIGPMAQINPIRYATKYYDSETGLYYFGQRYLDPITGQWLNREPLGEDESLNLYAYCHNDPVNRVDVLGLAEVVTTTPQGNPVAVNNSEAFWSLYGVFARQGRVAARPSDFLSLIQGTAQVSLRDAMIVAGALGGKLQNYNKAWPGQSSTLASSSDLWVLPQTASLHGQSGANVLDAGSAARMSRFGDVIELRVLQAAGEATGSFPWGTLSSAEISVALDRGYLSLWRSPICCTGGWTGNSDTPSDWTVMDRRGMDYAIQSNPFSTPLDVGAQMAVEFVSAGIGEWLQTLPRGGGVSVAAKATAPEMFYIENGVRRSLVSQNAGLSEIPATIFVPGKAPATTTLRLDQLLSPKPTVPLDSRYLRIQPPIVSPIQVQPLGLPGQLPSVPLRNVILE